MTEDFINFNNNSKIKDMVELLIKDSKEKAEYLVKLCTEE
jgi:hypothetical protein